jgi:hypothetical protein
MVCIGAGRSLPRLGAVMLTVALAGSAQSPPEREPPAQQTQQEPTPDPAARVAAAAARWLTSDQNSRELVESTVALLLAETPDATAWLAPALAVASSDPAAPRSKGVRALATHFVMGFLERERGAEMTFVGQYDPLLPLQPFVGDLLFGLLLETPDWYPYQLRDRLIAPLRDVQPRQPDLVRLEAVRRFAEDPQEPEAVRRGLACLLSQWGHPGPAQAIVARLKLATTEGDAEDRIPTTTELAFFLYELRDYKGAAMAFRTVQMLAEGLEHELPPVVHYTAACVHALRSDVERGIDALTACARRQGSPHCDPSLRLPRGLFEKDPEIALLRADERFAQILEMAFPPRDGR